jgi:hypothetical protein
LEPKKETSSPSQSPLSPLVLLGVLASSFALIGWFRSKINTPSHQLSQPVAKESSGPSKDISPIPSQHDHPRKDEDHTPGWKKAVEISAIVIAFTYATLTFLQWTALKHSIELSNRAWVGVSRPVEVTAVNYDAKNAKASYIVSLKNYGPSVALHVGIAAQVTTNLMQLVPLLQKDCKDAKGMANGLYISPVEKFAENILGETLYPSNEEGRYFDDQSFQPYPGIETPKELYVVGCIAYKDQFGNLRQTRFCNWYYGNLKEAKFPLFLYSFFGLNDAN